MSLTPGLPNPQVSSSPAAGSRKLCLHAWCNSPLSQPHTRLHLTSQLTRSLCLHFSLFFGPSHINLLGHKTPSTTPRHTPPFFFSFVTTKLKSYPGSSNILQSTTGSVTWLTQRPPFVMYLDVSFVLLCHPTVQSIPSVVLSMIPIWSCRELEDNCKSVSRHPTPPMKMARRLFHLLIHSAP